MLIILPVTNKIENISRSILDPLTKFPAIFKHTRKSA